MRGYYPSFSFSFFIFRNLCKSFRERKRKYILACNGNHHSYSLHIRKRSNSSKKERTQRAKSGALIITINNFTPPTQKQIFNPTLNTTPLLPPLVPFINCPKEITISILLLRIIKHGNNFFVVLF